VETSRRPFTAYRSFYAARFRTLLQYRGVAFGGMITQAFFGMIIVMVYEAFYRSTPAPQPMPLSQMRSYVWLGQAFLGMLPWNVEGEQRVMIRSGAVAYELLRPINLYSLWYARCLAWRTAPTLLRAVPIFMLALAFFGLLLPPSPASAAAWVLAMAGALLLGCAITTLLSIILMWTVSGEGITVLSCALVYILSGMSIPIPLMPDWLRPIVEILPFRGLIDTPFRLYLGHAPPSDLIPLLLHQLGWTAAIVLIGLAVMRRGLRRLSVFGG
jgi:ABC-2 type transport system permease protein